MHVAALFAAVAAAAAAALSPSQIAYTDLAGNVYVASTSGEAVTQIYENDGATALTTLGVSPDGARILALSAGDVQQLVLLPAAGGAPVPLPATEGADAGSFSADGVVYSIAGDAPGIYTLKLPGSTPKRVVVTPADATDSLPRVSPDGKQIAFVRQAVDDQGESSSTLQLVAASGGTPKALAAGVTATLADGGGLSFSPDGTTIAYAGDLGNPGIFTVPVAGGEPTQLTGDGDDWPTFSRDGATIFFSRDFTSSGASALTDGDIYELWAVALDGAGESLVAEGDFELVAVPPVARPTGGGSGGGSGSGSGSGGPSGGTAPAEGKKAASVRVVRNGPRYVVTWKGKAAWWTIVVTLGKKKEIAIVAGAQHSYAFTARGVKGKISATVRGA
jgi:Tol biopolymer transport system component